MQLVLRNLSEKDLQRVLDLQKQVVACLPDPEIYVATEKEDLLPAMKEDLVLGICDGEVLIAAAICIRNRACPGNLGQKWGEDPSKAFTFDAVFVHPERRGMGLQRKLIEAAKKIAKDEGAKSMWCTVSPENLFSYRNFTKAGFAPVEKNVLMYGGKLRDVLKLTL